MARRRRRSGWVPEFIWLRFRTRARTLADTVVSLIPPSPVSATQCRCNGKRCLGCSGKESMSFLIRADDPYEYRNLLKNCFVVVSQNAPCFKSFSPECRWPQIEVVRRSIEMVLCEQLRSSNLLCSGYDKINRSSPIVELLTSSTWDLLLKRVGDALMAYLLKWTSIFIPQLDMKHQQVAGPPISNLCYKFYGNKPESEYGQPSSFQPGKKRKRVDGGSLLSEIEHPCSLAGYTALSSSSVDNNVQKIEELPSNSNEKKVNPKKRRRPFSWQRQRKRNQTFLPKNEILSPCTMESESFSRSLQCVPDTSSIQLDNKCFCCSVLQVPRKVKETTQIKIHSILYKQECFSSALPSNHVLNNLNYSLTCANILLRHVFSLDVNTSPQLMACSRSSCSCLNGSACLYHSLLKTFKALIRRAKCCEYSRLFDKHCTVPSLEQNITPQTCAILECDESGNMVGPNISYCLKSQVVSFIWAVCRSIIPQDLLGTTSNWRILRRNISKFIRLRRFEQFSLKQIMHQLKTSKFSLFLNKHSFCFSKNQNPIGCTEEILQQKHRFIDSSHIMKRRLLERWVFWLFSCLVVPLIQANFYVTDSEHGKHGLFYYRKSDWKKLTESVITRMEDRNYLHLNDSSVKKILRDRSFGFSKLRLWPKGNGVRLLANLTRSSTMPSPNSTLKQKYWAMGRKSEAQLKRVKPGYFKSVNSLLRDLHAVLKSLKMNQPDKLGSSVFGQNDVYRVLCPFILGLKNGSTTIPSVYIVISDVAKAFDSIDHDKLLGVMKNLMRQDQYFFKQSLEVLCRNKSLWVHENLTLTDQIIGGSSTSTNSKSSGFLRSFGSVLVNKESRKCIKRSVLYSDLTEHVKRNIIQLDGKFYLQVLGIPQGSVLSGLLCSFYYGHLDRNVIYPFLEKACESNSENSSGTNICHDASSSTFSNAETDISSLSPKYVLLRYIDDFLFISTSKKHATNFFTRLQRGFREYNCFMNKEKSCLSFESHHTSGLKSNRVYVGDDGISYIQWSGLFIKCCSLEVQADYTRYLNNHLSSTITVSWQEEPGRHLKDKVCSYLRPKCLPLFYDSNINSAAVVRLNIYQSFLVCAMKFHCYFRDLSYICKLPTSNYLSTIEESIRYMYEHIRRLMRPSPVYLGSGFCPVLELARVEVEWLGLNAYIRVLKKKQSQHKELISLLTSKLLVHKISQNVPSPLKYAVDDCHSSLLWKIKY